MDKAGVAEEKPRRLFKAAPTNCEYAGFVSRLLALVIDLLIVSAVSLVTSAVGQFVGWALGVGRYTQFFLLGIAAFINIVFFIGYFVAFVVAAGQTPGQRILGVRVVPVQGTHVTARKSLRRLLGMLLGLPLFWGYLIVLVDDRRQAFHDHFASTYVIYDRR